MLDEQFGAALRTIRQERGLSQLALAAETEMAPRHLSDYERGKCEPTVPTIRKLAQALGCDAGRLLDGDGAAG